MNDPYAELGVAPDATADEVRRAYRERARRLHPDRAGGGTDATAAMARLNAAWHLLGDATRRAAYDRTLRRSAGRPAPTAPRTAGPSHAPPPRGARPTGSRRDQWVEGMRVQVARYLREAAVSASRTLAMRRKGLPKRVYDAQVEPLVAAGTSGMAELLQRARAAGAAPLDLGLTAALLGLSTEAVRVARQAAETPSPGPDLLARAEMIDRMWDTIAHEVRHDLVQDLGGSPHLARWVRRGA